MDILAVLTKVVKEQQKEALEYRKTISDLKEKLKIISELRQEIDELKKKSQ